MNGKSDLTRWNRAGLTRFRYVDGNAITHLETLRQAMIAAFSDPASGDLKWTALRDAIPQKAKETEQQRQERLIDQYHGERRDFAWEILRAYARSVHVVTEHLDAYANESYLGTASQWDNLRRLVEMLDYRPAPPASASTNLVLNAKAGRQGLVAAGFQVKNEPQDGSAPVIFETLADLEVDDRLNALRSADWDLSQEDFDYVQTGNVYAATFPLATPVEGVSKGSLGILVVEDPAGGASQALAVTVSQVAPDRLALQGAAPGGLAFPVKRWQMQLLLKPERIERPLIGDGVRLDRAANLTPDQSVVTWNAGDWRIAGVTAVQGDRVTLSGTLKPAVGTQLYRANRAGAQVLDILDKSESRLVLAAKRHGGAPLWDGDFNPIAAASVQQEKVSKAVAYEYLDGKSYPQAYYIPGESESLGQVVAVLSPSELSFSGDPGDLASGQWVAYKQNDVLKASRIEESIETEDGFQIKLGAALTGPIQTLYGQFALNLRPADYDRNRTGIDEATGPARVQSILNLDLAAADLPPALKKGRHIMVKNDTHAHLASVAEVQAETPVCIAIEPALPTAADGGPLFLRYDTVICGNLVEAGHGETKPEKILGSGDATRTGQSFRFDAKEVSFVADATQASGVAASAAVRVDGAVWQQVANLKDSEPEDSHYLVRMNEDGSLTLAFGDGTYGRRLPTGRNNLRIGYRTGVGEKGNLAAFSLKKPVAPHPLLQGVSQPLAATGGNGMEAVESLRANAPASLLTLERAVSVEDFAHLAATHSSVWQAKAVRLPARLARDETVRVVVVPAGGGALNGLAQTLEAFLEAHSAPGVRVEIADYQGLILDFEVTVRLDFAEYAPETLIASVEAALTSAFALQSVRLGEPVFRSRLFQLVEAVPGVKNSTCILRLNAASAGTPRHVGLGVDGLIKVIYPTDEQVLFWKPGLSAITVTAEAFSL